MPIRSILLTWACVLTATLDVGCAITASAQSRELTESEAKDLVIAALDPGVRKSPGLRADENNDPSTPDFYGFGITFENHPSLET